MPYSQIDDLPDPIREDLPTRAQELYREAYNSAEKEYDSTQQSPEAESVEDTAHRAAWETVKQKYEKKDGRWAPKKQ